MHDDDDRHTGEEPGDNRSRQEFGNPSKPQETHEGHEHSDHDGKDPNQVDIVGRPGRSEVCDPNREEWGDRGVCPDRHLRV